MLAHVVDRPREAPTSFKRLVHYLTDPQQCKERVVATRLSNLADCLGDDVSIRAAISQVEHTQSLTGPRAKQKTEHIVVSFNERELPTALVWEIEDKIMERVGYGSHQRVTVIHGDSDNRHLHIALNKVSRHERPNGAVWLNDHFQHDAAKLATACYFLQREFGVTPTNLAWGGTAPQRRAIAAYLRDGLAQVDVSGVGLLRAAYELGAVVRQSENGSHEMHHIPTGIAVPVGKVLKGFQMPQQTEKELYEALRAVNAELLEVKSYAQLQEIAASAGAVALQGEYGILFKSVAPDGSYSYISEFDLAVDRDELISNIPELVTERDDYVRDTYTRSGQEVGSPLPSEAYRYDDPTTQRGAAKDMAAFVDLAHREHLAGKDVFAFHERANGRSATLEVRGITDVSRALDVSQGEDGLMLETPYTVIRAAAPASVAHQWVAHWGDGQAPQAAEAVEEAAQEAVQMPEASDVPESAPDVADDAEKEAKERQEAEQELKEKERQERLDAAQRRMYRAVAYLTERDRRKDLLKQHERVKAPIWAELNEQIDGALKQVTAEDAKGDISAIKRIAETWGLELYSTKAGVFAGYHNGASALFPVATGARPGKDLPKAPQTEYPQELALLEKEIAGTKRRQQKYVEELATQEERDQFASDLVSLRRELEQGGSLPHAAARIAEREADNPVSEQLAEEAPSEAPQYEPASPAEEPAPAEREQQAEQVEQEVAERPKPLHSRGWQSDDVKAAQDLEQAAEERLQAAAARLQEAQNREQAAENLEEAAMRREGAAAKPTRGMSKFAAVSAAVADPSSLNRGYRVSKAAALASLMNPAQPLAVTPDKKRGR